MFPSKDLKICFPGPNVAKTEAFDAFASVGKTVYAVPQCSSTDPIQWSVALLHRLWFSRRCFWWLIQENKYVSSDLYICLHSYKIYFFFLEDLTPKDPIQWFVALLHRLCFWRRCFWWLIHENKYGSSDLYILYTHKIYFFLLGNLTPKDPIQWSVALHHSLWFWKRCFWWLTKNMLVAAISSWMMWS